MKSKWIWTLLVAVAALAAYAGNVLATPSTTPGFSGTTLAKATFGDLDIKAHTIPADVLERQAQDEGGFRPLRPAEHLGPEPLRRLHSQQRLAHPSRPEPGDRDAGHGDRIRRRRSDLHAARVLRQRDELVRRRRQRGRAHHPRRERRRGADGRRPAHPEGRHSTDRRDAGSGQLPVLRLIRQEGGIAALLSQTRLGAGRLAKRWAPQSLVGTCPSSTDSTRHTSSSSFTPTIRR